MERDLQIHTEDIDRLRVELGHVDQYFRRLGHERCDVFFGWAWSIDREKSDLAMNSVNIPLIDLEAEIRRSEESGLGYFGRDDLWVEFEGLGLKFQFCHHEGIHIHYAEPGEITRHFLSRWQAEGLAPKEFEKADGDLTWRPTFGGET